MITPTGRAVGDRLPGATERHRPTAVTTGAAGSASRRSTGASGRRRSPRWSARTPSSRRSATRSASDASATASSSSARGARARPRWRASSPRRSTAPTCATASRATRCPQLRRPSARAAPSTSSSSTPRPTTGSTTCASCCRASTRPPSDLRRKVFIIDEVQRIKEGWDVLLKTLEEPPDGVLFIFCTTDPSQIRPAVVSRLQRFTFRPLASAEIEGKLERILEAEGRRVEPDALALIARLAGGGMRDAESMLDQVLVSADDPVTVEVIARPAGARRRGLGRRASSMPSSRATCSPGIAVLDAPRGRGPRPGRLRRPGRRRACASSSSHGSLGRRRPSELEPDALAAAARRLTGIDASRSGLGGYRWQLELCLLAAATAGTPGSRCRRRRAGDGSSGPEPAPDRAGAPPRRAGRAARARTSRRRRAVARRAAPRRAVAAPEPVAAPRARGRPVASPRRARQQRRPRQLPSRAPAPSGDAASTSSAASGPRSSPPSARNPANRPLVASCRPVEVRDGVLVLGFPEDQAFLRDIAERKRLVIEDGIAAVLGRARRGTLRRDQPRARRRP